MERRAWCFNLSTTVCVFCITEPNAYVVLYNFVISDLHTVPSFPVVPYKSQYVSLNGATRVCLYIYLLAQTQLNQQRIFFIPWNDGLQVIIWCAVAVLYKQAGHHLLQKLQRGSCIFRFWLCWNNTWLNMEVSWELSLICFWVVID